MGFVAEAVRRGFQAPCVPNICTHTTLPLPVERASPGQVESEEGCRTHLSSSTFSLCEQVGDPHRGSGPPCRQPPAACSQSPRHWLSSLRPSHFPCQPSLPCPLTFWSPLGQSVLPSNCQTGACGHLSVSVLCPTPPPTPLAPRKHQPAALSAPVATPRCGLAGLPLPGFSNNCTSQRLTQLPSHTHSDRHTHTHTSE